MLPAIDQIAGSKNHWAKIIAFRGDECFGSLNDLRLASHFVRNESDFQAQLIFGKQRKRITTGVQHGNAGDAGFFMNEYSTLYLKITTDQADALNQNLLIDLGLELNSGIAACAEDGFTIFMVDTRVLSPKDIPEPNTDLDFDEFLKQGPSAFPKPEQSRIASRYGYTNGHAHM
jgi:hypothetical protein